jgi:dienelactone hydrolase
MMRRRRWFLTLVSALTLLLCHGAAPGRAAPVFAPARFDAAAIRDPQTLRAEASEARVQNNVRLSDLRFSSLAWDDRGQPHEIRIHAILALPIRPSGARPAIVSAHGLGAHAEASTAIEIARGLDAVALVIDAPGCGASEGEGPTAEDPRPIFRAAHDVRASWLYQYAFAAMRAVTYLRTRPDVDPRAIVMTGFSMGGVATWIAGGTDDRLSGVLPVAATGGFARLAEEPTWFRRLVLASAGARPSDPGPRAVFQKLDPLAFAGRQKGAVAYLMGAQDEFFTLDQVVATWRAVRARSKTLDVMPDYDHGWYFGGGQEGTPCPAGQLQPYCGPQSSYDRHDEFWTRWSLLLKMLITPAPTPAPPPPFIQRTSRQVVVRLATTPAPRAVRLAVSTDGGYTFEQHPLGVDPADGAYHLRMPLLASAILIAEVERSDGVVVSSPPLLPPGFVPRVRPFGPPATSASAAAR